ncbi:MAG TPA: TrkH family potassium uptake protein [Bacteroidales bacterium]|nr:TrkH family potassium uptake protein [Bacteroidales bacterium]
MPFKSEINFKLVARVLGNLMLVEGFALFFVLVISLLYGESDGRYFVYSALVALGLGGALRVFGRNPSTKAGKREGSMIVTYVWLLFSAIGALPFWWSAAIPSYTDAFFETMSGFTTTGASILNNIEELSHGILFWRSLTHWLGGLGIVVISMAILPFLGINGSQLFVAETTGPTKDKFSPKINDTARILFIVYISLTAAETVFLLFGRMSLFDAVTHSFSTIATGGFSTKQASISYWVSSPYIQYVLAAFMMLSGANFAMFFFGYKRQFFKIAENEELRYYIYIMFAASIVIMFSLIDFKGVVNFSVVEKAFRDSFFTISSLMTTTGFATVDYMSWNPFTWVVIAIIMLIGASAGSTAGGIKVVRIVIATKACYYEFKRMIHPSAVIPVKYNRQVVSQDVLTRVLVFIILYLVLTIIGILVLMISGMEVGESIGGMITCISCVGPGFGAVGPMGNFANIPEFSKWFLSFVMLLGRLELYTVLIIFTPAFWKK